MPGRRFSFRKSRGWAISPLMAFGSSIPPKNWAPPGSHQKGAIVANWGDNWIIENCEISDAKCVGISLGYVPGISSQPAALGEYGRHLVRNNTIRRCGQSGIAGHRGAAQCIIEGNLVEEINYRSEFGGWETAAIKFHAPINTIIRNNCIRKVRGPHSGGAYGIWLDWEAQGTRISGNVIYDTEWAALTSRSTTARF